VTAMTEQTNNCEGCAILHGYIARLKEEIKVLKQTLDAATKEER
jgi:AhpD family alkylhydroperoxidase